MEALTYKGMLTCLEDTKELKEHDNKVIDELLENATKELNSLKFETGRAWFDFDAGIDRCVEHLTKVAEQMKSN